MEQRGTGHGALLSPRPGGVNRTRARRGAIVAARIDRKALQRPPYGRTLKLAQTIDFGARTHHVDEGTYKATDRFVMVDVGDPVVGAALLDPNAENRVIGTIPWYLTGGRPYSAWSDPSGRYAYVTVRPHVATMNSWISKIDLEPLEEVQAHEIGYGAVWVAENRGNEITIIDVATDTVTGHIPVPGDAHSVRFVRF